MMTLRHSIVAAALILASAAAFSQTILDARSGVCEDSSCGRRTVLVNSPPGGANAKTTSTTTAGESAPACKPSSEQKTVVGCGAKNLPGTITYRRDFNCANEGNSGAWTAWYETSSTCTVEKMPASMPAGDWDIMPADPVD